MMTECFSEVLYAETEQKTAKKSNFDISNNQIKKTPQKLKNERKMSVLKKGEKIFVKMTKSSKTEPIFCIKLTKIGGFFAVFGSKKS